MATIWSDSNSINYHLKQWGEAKESTREFIKFLSGQILPESNYLDLGCGAGAATYLLSKEFKDSFWTGVDLDPELISIANQFRNKLEANNLDFVEGNLEKFGTLGIYQGVVSLQTLSWLEDYRPTFDNVFGKLEPSWFALTSLFYEGNISAYTKVHEHGLNRKLSYNTYSIPQVRAAAEKYGYKLARCQPFDINIDLPKQPSLDSMGTFTRRVLQGNSFTRIQVSGPLIMNWYMLLFIKSHS